MPAVAVKDGRAVRVYAHCLDRDVLRKILDKVEKDIDK
jgi:hypothetical protein